MVLRFTPRSPRRRIRLVTVVCELTALPARLSRHRLRKLDASNGRQDHTASPYATIMIRPSIGTRRQSYNSDFQNCEVKYFLFGGLTRFLEIGSDLPDGWIGVPPRRLFVKEFAGIGFDRRIVRMPSGRKSLAPSASSSAQKFLRSASPPKQMRPPPVHLTEAALNITSRRGAT